MLAAAASSPRRRPALPGHRRCPPRVGCSHRRCRWGQHRRLLHRHQGRRRCRACPERRRCRHLRRGACRRCRPRRCPALRWVRRGCRRRAGPPGRTNETTSGRNALRMRTALPVGRFWNPPPPPRRNRFHGRRPGRSLQATRGRHADKVVSGQSIGPPRPGRQRRAGDVRMVSGPGGRGGAGGGPGVGRGRDPDPDPDPSGGIVVVVPAPASRFIGPAVAVAGPPGGLPAMAVAGRRPAPGHPVVAALVPAPVPGDPDRTAARRGGARLDDRRWWRHVDERGLVIDGFVDGGAGGHRDRIGAPPIPGALNPGAIFQRPPRGFPDVTRARRGPLRSVHRHVDGRHLHAHVHVGGGGAGQERHRRHSGHQTRS